MNRLLSCLILFLSMHVLPVYEYKPMSHQSRQHSALFFIYLLCTPVSWKHAVTLPAKNVVDEIEWTGPRQVFTLASPHQKQEHDSQEIWGPRCHDLYRLPSRKQHKPLCKYKCEESEQKWNGNLRRK